jgi:hypothetical protein
MPLSLEVGVIIDLARRAEGKSAVRATDKHHIGGRSPGRQSTEQHVNIVVSRTAGAVDREEELPS